MKRFLENELVAWKNKAEYLPLLLRGARQVGKSYLVEHFGKTHFDNLIIVLLERYSNIAHIDKEVRSRDLKPALHLLTCAGVFNQIFSTDAAGLPLHAHMQEHRFKLLSLGVRISEHNIAFDSRILSLPFYLIYALDLLRKYYG
jgi:hypothetical protein